MTDQAAPDFNADSADHYGRLSTAMQRLRDAESRTVHDADEKEAELQEAIEEVYAALTEASVQWLEEKWGPERTCPYCGALDWVVSRPFNLLLESREALAPHFSVACTNCGNTVLVNAVVAGLVPTPADDDPL
jgi:hypothetical protein